MRRRTMIHEALIYSDGGKNDARGCYGSILITVDSDEKRRNTFNYPKAKTSNEAEVNTLRLALAYIQDIERDHPKRVNWTIALDAKFLFEHLTIPGRKISPKFQETITNMLEIIKEYDVTVIQITGKIMKSIIGH
jgi:ribonuclease HI